MERISFQSLGKWLGVVSSTAALLLWLGFADANRYSAEAISPAAWSTIAFMIVLAAAGILASLLEKPLFMFLIFLLSFIPVGMYLFGVPSIYRFIGLSNLLFFAAGIILLSTRYKIHITSRQC